MNPRETRATEIEELVRTLCKAAQAHERALLVELWAADYFDRRGQASTAQRHRDAAERQASLAENRHARLSELV